MKPSTNIRFIQQTVAEYFEISVENLLSKKKAREFSYPRMIAMYLSQDLLGMGCTLVGRHFGRDHTTVLHAVNWVTKRPRIDMHVENLKKIIGEKMYAAHRGDKQGEIGINGAGNETGGRQDTKYFYEDGEHTGSNV